MYSRIFEAVPEAKPLFKGDLQEQQAHYMRMLQSIVKLTRSSHLWPVRAFTGTASLPVLDKLGTIHADVGITRGHFDLMKSVLAQCCREIDPVAFTPGVEKALGFIFDVVGNSLTKSTDVREEELARKNKLPLRGDEQPVEDFDRFFSGTLPAGMPQVQTLH
jgi:hemoglobin-like flavoprotein